MDMILNALKYLAYVLIFPGFLFCFLSGLLLCGIDRKLVARMQKRVGPPILQPFYDSSQRPPVSGLHPHLPGLPVLLPLRHAAGRH